MFLTSLIIGAGIAMGAGIVAEFWDKISNLINQTIAMVVSVSKKCIAHIKVLMKKINERLVELITKSYSQNEYGNWTERTETREIPMNEIPEEIRNNFKRKNEIDITKELNLEL